MAYNVEKLAKLGALKELGLKQKAVDEAQNKRIKALEDVGAQANVLEGVKVNGVAWPSLRRWWTFWLPPAPRTVAFPWLVPMSPSRVWLHWPTRRRFPSLTSTTLWLLFWLQRPTRPLLWVDTASPTLTPRTRSTPRSALSISPLALWSFLRCPLWLRTFWATSTT